LCVNKSFMKRFILGVIDFFYPPFSKVIPMQTFRYLACGGGNTLLDITLFTIAFKFILHEQDVVLFSWLTISAHIAALFMALAVTFPTGFMLSKYIVFSESNLRGHVQLVRYFILVGVCVLLNYVFMKLFVDILHIFPPLAKVFTTVFVVAFSYLTQKKFTFSVKANGEVLTTIEEPQNII
jgi:putative flippase GtrA